MSKRERPASGSDREAIALVTTAHFFSHLYIMALPPLFPVLTAELGISATSLGLALALYNVTTAILQTPMGMAVDRFGPGAILVAGQALAAMAFILVGLVPGYGMLLLAMVVGGIGNSVYHPADYAVLAHRVDSRRAGRAFSIHTFGGFLGFAMAPPVMVAIHTLAGWQAALLTIGTAGLLLAIILGARRRVLETPRQLSPSSSGGSGEQECPRLVLSAPIILAFLFFAAISMAHTGFASFGILALERGRGLELAAATAPVTAYLFASAGGVLLGGWIADRIEAHDRLVMGAALLCVALALPLAVLDLPLAALVAVLAVVGTASGVIAPSRDMIVRKLAPEGRSGVVFGFVTTGFNAGGLIAPPLYGLTIDAGAPAGVFVISALFFASIVVTLGWQSRLPRRRA